MIITITIRGNAFSYILAWQHEAWALNTLSISIHSLSRINRLWLPLHSHSITYFLSTILSKANFIRITLLTCSIFQNLFIFLTYFLYTSFFVDFISNIVIDSTTFTYTSLEYLFIEFTVYPITCSSIKLWNLVVWTAPTCRFSVFFNSKQRQFRLTYWLEALFYLTFFSFLIFRTFFTFTVL